jgi:peptidoglycan glycosyltransferase
VELAWSCIGQYTDQINPCTFLTFIGAVANGGTAVKPYVVSQITVGEDTTYRAKRETVSRMLSGDLSQTLQEMMRNNVVTKYGADRFAGLTVCAKSGTSELGGGLAPNAMFTGFVMEEEYPLAFIVVVENGGYGASTCIPVIAPVLAACKAALDGE